jgi:hypothetical protein
VKQSEERGNCIMRSFITFTLSPNIIRIIKTRRVRWAGNVACMGEKRNMYRCLVGKPEGKRPLAKRRRKWDDNIKMNF